MEATSCALSMPRAESRKVHSSCVKSSHITLLDGFQLLTLAAFLTLVVWRTVNLLIRSKVNPLTFSPVRKGKSGTIRSFRRNVSWPAPMEQPTRPIALASLGTSRGPSGRAADGRRPVPAEEMSRSF